MSDDNRHDYRRADIDPYVITVMETALTDGNKMIRFCVADPRVVQPLIEVANIIESPTKKIVALRLCPYTDSEIFECCIPLPEATQKAMLFATQYIGGLKTAEGIAQAIMDSYQQQTEN
jgi:hypothetical protein